MIGRLIALAFLLGISIDADAQRRGDPAPSYDQQRANELSRIRSLIGSESQLQFVEEALGIRLDTSAEGYSQVRQHHRDYFRIIRQRSLATPTVDGVALTRHMGLIKDVENADSGLLVGDLIVGANKEPTLGFERPEHKPLYAQTILLCRGERLSLTILRPPGNGTSFYRTRTVEIVVPASASACAPYSSRKELIATESNPFPGMLRGESENLYFEFFGCGRDVIANAYLTFDSRASWERFKFESPRKLKNLLRNVHKGTHRGFDCQPAPLSETRIQILKMPGKELLDEYAMVRQGNGDYLIPANSLTPSGKLLYSPDSVNQAAFLHLWELGLSWELDQSWISANIPFYYLEFALRYPKWCPDDIEEWSRFTASIVETDQFGNRQRTLNQRSWDIDARTARHVDTWYDNYRLAILVRGSVERDVAKLNFGCDSQRLKRLKKAFYEYEDY